MEYLEAFQFANQYLLSGEAVLWKGRPEKGNIITRRETILLPFSIMVCAFSLFWEYMALQSGVPFFALWGLPIVCIGLYMLFGRHIQTAYLRNKTFYVITSKKLIIKKGRRISIYDGRDLPPMEIEVHKNGNGTLLFYDQVYTRRGHRHTTYIALENLKDFVHAQNAISQMEQ